MAQGTIAALGGSSAALPRNGNAALAPLRRVRRAAPFGILAAITLIVVALVAIFAPYSPLETDYLATQFPPSPQHLLGADHLGRDVLSRIIYGAQVTLTVSLASVGLDVSLGMIRGIASGYSGQRFDMIS